MSVPLSQAASVCIKALSDEDDFLFVQTADPAVSPKSFDLNSESAAEESVPRVAGVDIPEEIFQAFFKSV